MNKNLIVLLPDGGAYKWGVKLMDKLGFSGEVLACSKNRSYKEGKSTLKQQLPDFDFGGKDVLIIDDICVRGGTFVGLAKMLKERNVGKIYLAVSHITLEELNPDLMEAFDKVFTTNSKGFGYYVTKEAGGVKYGEAPKNLKVFNMFN